MLRRKALEGFAAWRDEHGNRALLVTGARQVGKAYLVREFLHAEYENVIEFDLVEQGDVREAFDAARNADELFMDDVGLLCRACGMDVVKGILSDRLGVNCGSVYENAVAQELKAHGHDLHYFRNKKLGEADFVCESGGGAVLPIEVKSGKDYKRHSALSNILSSPNYEIEQAIVLCEGNVNKAGKVLYLPTYMTMFV